jgi:hypothetical protein
MGQKLRGVLGQRMSGQRAERVRVCGVYEYLVAQTVAVSKGTGRTVFAEAFLVGPGGGGNGSSQGSGGGASLVKRFKLAPGQSCQIVIPVGGAGGAVGADGADTVLTLPGGITCRAGGGKADGRGGVAEGGDLNRAGGAGGVGFANGLAGDHGGAGGAGNGFGSGGGGPAGFSDIGTLTWGIGADASSVPVAPPGNGGGGPASTTGGAGGAGAPGAAKIVFTRRAV